MKKSLLLVPTMLLLLAGTMMVYAQEDLTKGTIVPALSNFAPIGKPQTHLFIFYPDTGINPAIPGGENPASIACIYGLVPPTSGCPKSSTLVPTGGAKAVVLVDFGRYSALQTDLDKFSDTWGLPRTTLQEICSPGPPPCPDNTGSGWDIEEALDIEYAHAMAPNATIYLSEWTNDPLMDNAETNGAAAASAAGGGEVSNSWTYNGGENWCGGGPCELGYDHYFSVPTVVFFAAAGDGGLGPLYPSISPNVVSAGGTHIVRSGGNFTGSETCWSGSGGGFSVYEPSPSYQRVLRTTPTIMRGTPDISADADPVTGVSVVLRGGFNIVGGTSVASPLLAGYINNAGSFHNSTNDELTEAYNWYAISPFTYATYFRDETMGSNGSPARKGWDECTGLGSPIKPSGF
jgi:kumamolisin